MIKKSIYTLLIISFVMISSHNSYAASFIPTLTVSEEYNDNIYLDENDENKVDDWITIISPGFMLEAKTRKSGVLFDYNFSHSNYSKNPENNSFRHNGFVDSWLRLSRHTELGFSNKFIQTEENLTGEESTGIRNDRQVYYSNAATADFNHTFAENSSINIAYTYSILENKDTTIEDNQSHKCSLLLKYNLIRHLDLEEETSYENGEYEVSPGFVRIKSRTRLTKTVSSKFDMFVEYTHTDFKNETPDNGSNNIWGNTNWSYENGSTFSITDYSVEPDYDYESYRVYNPSSGFNWTFEEGGTISLNVGYFIQERDLEENESGVTIAGDIGKQWRFKKGLISIKGNSGYEDTQLQSENLGFNIYYQGGIGLEYYFTRTLQSKIDISYRSDNYVNSGTDETDREDKNYNLNISTSWRTVKWLNTNCSYSYQNRDSNNDSNDYVENKIKLQLSLVLAGW